MRRYNTFFLFLIWLPSFAQQTDTRNQDEEKSYFKLIYEVCPDADILELEYKEDYIEIEYLCGTIYNEIGIKNGEILFTESEANKTIIPIEKIQKKLDKKYDGWLFDEVSLITMQDTSFFKVEIIKDGVEQNLFFTRNGKIYKPNLLEKSDRWSVEKLTNYNAFNSAHYTFLSPDSTYQLPEVLKEISGIKSVGTHTAFCVQDELGAVFVYDFEKREVTDLFRFIDYGDFEDLAIKNETVFILRSDGTIFFFNYKHKEKISERHISLDALDFESLTYAPSNDRFYILSKDAGMSTGPLKRVVYEFSKDNLTKPTEKFTINIPELSAMFITQYSGVANKNIKFNPSAIAIHPITGEFYILSANERLLARYSEGVLQQIYPLPASLYYKPEGLAFYPNGDLLISSEGDKQGFINGRIHFFKYQ